MSITAPGASPVIVDGSNRTLDQARAEAKYLAGSHLESARLWIDLHESNEACWEPAFKAALCYFAMGRNQDGWTWLDQADADGAAPWELACVRAQFADAAGLRSRAEDWLEVAVGLHPRSGFVTNLRGVLASRRGELEQARTLFRLALRQDPDLAEPRINLAALGCDDADDLLAEASVLAPHRLEPYHHAWRACDDTTAPRLSGDLATRLRVRRLVVREPGQDADRAPERHRPVRPLSLAIEAVDGDLLELRLRFAEGLTIDLGDWQPSPGATDPVTDGSIRSIQLTNRSAGRGMRVRNDEVELAAQRLPDVPGAHWTLDGVPDGWLGWASTISDDDPRPDLVALYRPATVEASHPVPFAVHGNISPPAMRRAGFTFATAVVLWADYLGVPPPAVPPIVVVDRPGSSFCYARPSHVRFPSTVMTDPTKAGHLYHEAGHVFWGLRTRFTADATWLTEALAEFSCHLAEDGGRLPGYREALIQIMNGSPPERFAVALLDAAREERPDTAAALRVRGGFVVSALRALMGDAPFIDLLRTLWHHTGSPLSTWDVEALASHHHGRSLRWFFNQWVHRSETMRFECRRTGLRSTGAGWELDLEVLCAGGATPGMPVPLAVRTDAGDVQTTVALELGPRRLCLPCPAPPRSVDIDPERRLPATNTSLPIEPESS